MERKQQKDHLKLLREQEKVQRHEQMRVERELRAQQILEVKSETDRESIVGRWDNTQIGNWSSINTNRNRIGESVIIKQYNT